MSAAWVKDPDAILDYTVDWSAWLVDDTIATLTVTPDDGITIDSSSHTDTTATAIISGGTAGNSYSVRFHIVTAGARTDDRTIALFVEQR